MRIKFLALLCAATLLGPVGAAETAPATSPTMQDMAKWKQDVLSKFDDVIYLDADARPISEDAFFRRVVSERRGFKMHTDSTAPRRMTIQLLNEDEQQAAQAGAPHA